jgi:EAL domain-containing protein (putative c-di-GMP-specific phosphodiesterase class I)
MSYFYELNDILASHFKNDIRNKKLKFSMVPQVDINSGQSHVADVNMSWQSELYGNVPVERFMRVADLYGFMDELMEWAFTEIVSHLYECERQKIDYSLSIPIAAQSLNASLMQTIETLLANHPITPNRLLIELNEKDFWEHFSTIKPFIAQLKKMNIQLGLNHYGIHEKSINALLLPIDQYKIHAHNFIEGGLEGSCVLQLLVESIQQFEKICICDNVKTWHHYNWVKKFGIERAQGEFFRKSIPLTVQNLESLSHIRFPEGVHQKIRRTT